MEDIELVIKIPKKWFDDMVKEEFIDIDELCAVIQHSTQLPKGHGRLIDADELKYKINSFDNDVMEEDWYALYDNVMSDIDSAPIIIEADIESENNDDYYKGAQEEY